MLENSFDTRKKTLENSLGMITKPINFIFCSLFSHSWFYGLKRINSRVPNIILCFVHNNGGCDSRKSNKNTFPFYAISFENHVHVHFSIFCTGSRFSNMKQVPFRVQPRNYHAESSSNANDKTQTQICTIE